MPSFYNGKRFFLTYPRCDKSKEQLLTFFRTRGQVFRYTIAEEKHADGTPHLHACIEFEDTERHDMRWLDFEGHHPNKQDPRNWNACREYCRKDKNFIEDDSQRMESTLQSIDLALEVLKYDKKIDWMSYCAGKKISFQYADYAWREVHSPNATILLDEHDGRMCNALQSFCFSPDLHRCLILIGESGCGKTTWAKRNMPKPCLFVSHIDDLKCFDPCLHKSIIFDDVSFTHYPRTAQIAIVDFDNPRSIHCRHSNAFIPAGIYKCFTANELPLLTSDPAIRRRIRIYNIQ